MSIASAMEVELARGRGRRIVAEDIRWAPNAVGSPGATTMLRRTPARSPSGGTGETLDSVRGRHEIALDGI